MKAELVTRAPNQGIGTAAQNRTFPEQLMAGVVPLTVHSAVHAKILKKTFQIMPPASKVKTKSN